MPTEARAAKLTGIDQSISKRGKFLNNISYFRAQLICGTVEKAMYETGV